MADSFIDEVLTPNSKGEHEPTPRNVMATFLSTLLNIAVIIFAVTSMLSVGFGHTLREIIGPLRHPRGVIRVLAANFVLVPLLAFGVGRLLSLDQPLEIGLM